MYQNKTLISEKTYAGSFIYNNEGLEYVLFDEGRLTPSAGDIFYYEYFLKDLPINIGIGNTRVVFKKKTGGVAILQVGAKRISRSRSEIGKTHYYPFGMEFMGTPSVTMDVENFYKYNGKELQTDGFDLDANGVVESRLLWYDYGARFYDAALGRWHVPDQMIEKHFDQSAYTYTYNNPINFIDPFGLDTLEVNLPSDRTDEGTMTLTVNGEEIDFAGGNEILGKGTTNGGQNPTRDPGETNGDTPTGEATVSYVKDKDENGDFVNNDGTPVENPEGNPSASLKATGRYFISLNPESGEIQTSNRTFLGIHGGGTSLGENALNAQQDLVGTLGCLRVTNQSAATIADYVESATDENRTFRVIINQDDNNE